MSKGECRHIAILTLWWYICATKNFWKGGKANIVASLNSTDNMLLKQDKQQKCKHVLSQLLYIHFVSHKHTNLSNLSRNTTELRHFISALVHQTEYSNYAIPINECMPLFLSAFCTWVVLINMLHGIFAIVAVLIGLVVYHHIKKRFVTNSIEGENVLQIVVTLCYLVVQCSLGSYICICSCCGLLRFELFMMFKEWLLLQRFFSLPETAYYGDIHF